MMTSTIHLTDLDHRIISEVQKDATISTAELAARAGSSPATCWRRLKALEEAGVIGRTVRLVDPAALGRGIDAFCNVRMKSQNIESRRNFQRSLDLEPAIIEAYSMTGEWDYLLHLVVRDIADAEEILMRRILDHESVAGASTIFALRRIKHTTEIPG